MINHNAIQEDAVTIDPVLTDSIVSKKLQLSVLRLDKIHPVISGNKWFKLKYYLQDAKSQGYNSMLTFGGAFSNHIAATALAASLQKLQSIGIIRGEEPKLWSHTLQEAKANGMELHFVSREEYDMLKRTGDNQLLKQFGNNYIISEGGYGELGVKGASDILTILDTSSFTHIICAVGTGTTVAGIIKAALPHQHIIGISAMKNNTGLSAEIIELLQPGSLPANFMLNHDYHFGGYAKHTPELLCWMNDFFSASHIPLDFVYTAKAMYGIMDMIAKDHFEPGAKILMMHTGGLQGNLSTKPGLLKF
ncbi:MAG: pyridoxal-phosphate dependent enzyme [Chitinophagaceae bacterium]|nr:pyridoxal-phosphate dependent enzyme [Chitinophagaceae bacterium]